MQDHRHQRTPQRPELRGLSFAGGGSHSDPQVDPGELRRQRLVRCNRGRSTKRPEASTPDEGAISESLAGYAVLVASSISSTTTPALTNCSSPARTVEDTIKAPVDSWTRPDDVNCAPSVPPD